MPVLILNHFDFYDLSYPLTFFDYHPSKIGRNLSYYLSHRLIILYFTRHFYIASLIFHFDNVVGYFHFGSTALILSNYLQACY